MDLHSGVAYLTIDTSSLAALHLRALHRGNNPLPAFGPLSDLRPVPHTHPSIETATTMPFLLGKERRALFTYTLNREKQKRLCDPAKAIEVGVYSQDPLPNHIETMCAVHFELTTKFFLLIQDLARQAIKAAKDSANHRDMFGAVLRDFEAMCRRMGVHGALEQMKLELLSLAKYVMLH